MSDLRPVRGTHDWLPAQSAQYRFVVQTALQIVRCYGFGEIMTPIFEFSDVFHRTLGETSDVVSKETYSFEDRGGESLTLRPELTASVVRAFISNKLQDQLPFKVFYHGPAFRYERPQKGRLRQFHQLGAEMLGAAEPQADAQMIAMCAQLLRTLGLEGAVTLELNSLGDALSRAAYREALVAYFQAHQAELSEDSLIRLAKNPLRILDSKDEGDKALSAEAPQMQTFFNDNSRAFFDTLCAQLGALGIAYRVNPRLVRGLDYYNHTVFEFTTTLLGAQGTVLAGGRYNGLVKQMGGADVAGLGFAAGIERLIALCDEVSSLPTQSIVPVVVLPLAEGEASLHALMLTQQLRGLGLVVELMGKGNMGKQLGKADKMGACAVLLLGEDELAAQQVTLRDLRSKEQRRVALADIAAALENYRALQSIG